MRGFAVKTLSVIRNEFLGCGFAGWELLISTHLYSSLLISTHLYSPLLTGITIVAIGTLVADIALTGFTLRISALALTKVTVIHGGERSTRVRNPLVAI